jgi:hypothetical protein
MGFVDHSGRTFGNDASWAHTAPGFGVGHPERQTDQRETAQALRAAFVQGGPADTLAPGALLAALTEAAFADEARLNDDELTGALEAARRLANRAHYLETLATAELARRRAAQYEQDTARGVPRNQRRAQFPDLELAAQLLIGRRHAQHLLDEAVELMTRLPRTLAGMADGLIDPARASAIASATLCLSDSGAAHIDQSLAPGAHEVRVDTVARRAAALAMKLDPEAVAREKQDARRTRQRVEARREQSGNASFSIREAETSMVMSVEAAIGELAVRLRDGGAEGTLDALRAMAALDRLLARDPLDRLAPLPSEPAESDWAEDDGYPDGRAAGHPDTQNAPRKPEPADRQGDASNGPGRPKVSDADERPDNDRHPGASVDDEHENGSGLRCPSSPGTCDVSVDDERERESGVSYPPRPLASRQAKLPALINLIVPAAALLGWGTAPGQAGTWGLTDPQETRDIVQAASYDPRTRWCLTVVNERGEAIAHACARGRHPWTPQSPDPPPGIPGTASSTGERSARVQEFLTALGLSPGALAPIAQDACDHRHAEPRYAPSRKLRHLIRARTQTCTAPGCGGQSVHADLDHLLPYPDGPTDECNLHPPCRAHHRAKQAPGWRVAQPEPGVIRWTLPSGRARTTRPTIYDC